MRTGFRKFANILGWLCAFVASLILAAVFYVGKKQHEFIVKAADFSLGQLAEVPQRSAVYDANGELYSHLPGLNRKVVEFEQISGWFVQALVAREDARFWRHNGIDPEGIARAALANFRGHGIRQGASTITQQLARNSFELGGRTYERKALEAALAVRIEQNYSKKQILELYMNRIYFGSGLYGIEAAALGYFGKPAADLSLGESAILAGLICSPNRFSPTKHPEQAITERDEVLERMLHEQMVTPQEVAAAKALRVETMSKPAFHTEDDYVTDAVIRALAALLDPEVIERGGLRVTTTIDPHLQKLAEEAADRRMVEVEAQKKFPHPKRADFAAGTDDQGVELPTKYLQAAVVVIDNKTAAIRACVGGRDYHESKYHRALLANRQIGSTFKPFVYAAAFERGLLPGTLVNDEKIAPHEFANIPVNWSPANSDGDYMGLQPAAFGLIKSRNTMSVRVGEMVGLPAVRKLAESVGIGEKMPEYPVSFLGAFETNLRNLTAAYATFPNGGIYRAPYLIARVENQKGEVLYEAEAKACRVMQPETAWTVTSCLQDVMKTGTAAKAAQLGWKKPAAGKTGTTNDFKDAWFVGYTQSLTCGVWVGMDQPETIMEKGYGSALALPIWVDVMLGAPSQAYPTAPLAPPCALAPVRLCSVSGGLASSGCEAAHTGYTGLLPNSRIPTQRCSLHAELPSPAALVTSDSARGSYPAPSPAGYGPAAAPSAPPLIMNGTRVYNAPTGSPYPAGGGARPLAAVSGASRQTDRAAFTPNDGVRVMRAQPANADLRGYGTRPRATDRSNGFDESDPIVREQIPAQREESPGDEDSSRREDDRQGGFFHRLFSKRR